MVKCISFGDWNKKNIYIILSVLFLLITKYFLGYKFDEEDKLEIKFLDNGVFSEHYLIHQIFFYLFCIIISGVLFIWEKIMQKISLNKEKNNQELSKDIRTLDSLVRDLTLIYREAYEKDKPKFPKIFIVSTLILYIILEQANLIFKKFFLNMDFWMIELYIVAYFNYKIFKIRIFRHQMLAFSINLISIILNTLSVILTIKEEKEEKALYVKYKLLVIIAFIIYCLYAFFISYTFINIKKLMDLKFMSFNVILLVYGIIGFIFCICFCLLVGNFSCQNDIAKYLFKVKDENDQTYIDNFNVYYNSFINSSYKGNEIILVISCSLSFGLYKLFSFKIIEELTILHKIFSDPIYYFFQKIVILCSRAVQIHEMNDIIITNFIIDLLSDFLSFIGYLIYIEIIEINICNFNYNLRKNIMLRGRTESSIYDGNLGIFEDDEDITDDSKDKFSSNVSIMY